jgi:glycosyltransferase involved in cell wall biosynthesis
MKIQIFGARTIPARWSGFDNTATELAIRFAREKHDVEVYVMARYCLPSKPKIYEGVKLVYIPTYYGKFTETVLHEILSAFVGLFKITDINYVLGCRTSWVYTIYRLFGKNVVFNTDGLDFKRKKWGFIAQSYLRICYWIAAKISTNLIHDNTHIKKYFNDNYKADGVFISIGGSVYNSNSDVVIKNYDVQSKEYYLIACRFEPENNIHHLLRGFISSSSKKKLLIAGGANYKSKYLSDIQSVVDSRVVFLGPIYKDNHIEELHYHCFAYLHGHEVGGTNPSLLKAMGCGNLILANDVNYNREVLGDNGIFFENTVSDIRQKIDFIESHSSELSDLGKMAQERLLKYYTWDYSAELHREYFEYINGNRKNFRETF